MNYHLDADIRWAHDNGYGINNLKQYVCAYVRARARAYETGMWRMKHTYLAGQCEGKAVNIALENVIKTIFPLI